MSGEVAKPKPIHPFLHVMNHIPTIEQELMSPPSCPVWIHEKVLYSLLRVPSGHTFGQRAMLSCVLKSIDRGYCGAKREGRKVVMRHHVPGFCNEKNCSRVSFQFNGLGDSFENGSLCEPTLSRPRWFRSVEALTDIKTQREIVQELMGDVDNLPEDVKQRRKSNYREFVGGEDVDQAFLRLDVPQIAYNFRDIWGEDIIPNHKYIIRGRVLCRVFCPKHMKRIEDFMRLFLVATNVYGKLHVSNGKLRPTKPSRRSQRRDTIDHPHSQPHCQPKESCTLQSTSAPSS